MASWVFACQHPLNLTHTCPRTKPCTKVTITVLFHYILGSLFFVFFFNPSSWGYSPYWFVSDLYQCHPLLFLRDSSTLHEAAVFIAVFSSILWPCNLFRHVPTDSSVGCFGFLVMINQVAYKPIILQLTVERHGGWVCWHLVRWKSAYNFGLSKNLTKIIVCYGQEALLRT